MRGSQTLNTQLPLLVEEKIPNRLRRREAIASRFYYYHTIIGYRYERCLRELSIEFYLSEQTLIDILLDANSIVNKLSQEQVSVKQLEAKFPYLKWLK